jgi:hypothetical protein
MCTLGAPGIPELILREMPSTANTAIHCSGSGKGYRSSQHFSNVDEFVVLLATCSQALHMDIKRA